MMVLFTWLLELNKIIVCWLDNINSSYDAAELKVTLPISYTKYFGTSLCNGMGLSYDIGLIDKTMSVLTCAYGKRLQSIITVGY